MKYKNRIINEIIETRWSTSAFMFALMGMVFFSMSMYLFESSNHETDSVEMIRLTMAGTEALNLGENLFLIGMFLLVVSILTKAISFYFARHRNKTLSYYKIDKVI